MASGHFGAVLVIDLVAALAAGIRAAVWYGNVGSCGRSRGNDGGCSRGVLGDGHELGVGLAVEFSLHLNLAAFRLVGNSQLAVLFNVHAFGLGDDRPSDIHWGGRVVVINTQGNKRQGICFSGIWCCVGDIHCQRVTVNIVNDVDSGHGFRSGTVKFLCQLQCCAVKHLDRIAGTRLYIVQCRCESLALFRL